jgi:acetoin utilization protein AcuB
LTSVENGGIQIGFQVADKPGKLKEVADIIGAFDGRMFRILFSCDDVPEGYRKVYIRMHGIEHFRLPSLKQALIEKAALLYMVGHRENICEIFSEQIN